MQNIERININPSNMGQAHKILLSTFLKCGKKQIIFAVEINNEPSHPG